MNFAKYIKKKSGDLKVVVAFLLVCAALAGAGIWAWNDYITSPPYVDEKRYPVRGLDVSSHNGMMNFEAIASQGYKFVFIKATEGTDFKDSNFKLNYDKAARAGLKIGAYHFFRFDSDGVSQAVNLLKTIGNKPLDLGIAIDVEQQGNPKNIPSEAIQDRLSAMVDFLHLKGHRVIFYSNPQGVYDYLSENFQGYSLWICSFSRFPFAGDWTFWQYNHHGKVRGVNGDVDLNTFNGSLKEWDDYLSSKPTTIKKR